MYVNAHMYMPPHIGTYIYSHKYAYLHTLVVILLLATMKTGEIDTQALAKEVLEHWRNRLF